MDNLIVQSMPEVSGELSYQLADFKDRMQKLCRPVSFDISESQLQEQVNQLQVLLGAVREWGDTIINVYGAVSVETETSMMIYAIEYALSERLDNLFG